MAVFMQDIVGVVAAIAVVAVVVVLRIAAHSS